MTTVKTLAINTAGRDFVVGDIHGAFDLVWRAMEAAHFDPATDRLFSVGDLIDRSPGSRRCAKFLAQPYVYAVRGNHEDMLLDLCADGDPRPEVLRFAARINPGFSWWLDVPETDRRPILEALSALPIAITIETARGTVGIVHADVPEGLSWQDFTARLAAQDEKTWHIALYGRDRIHSEDDSGVPGVGRIFVGHTPRWDGLRRYGNVYAVDTGAVFALLAIKPEGRLTLANMAMATESLTEERATDLIDLRDADVPETPFGSYAAGPTP